MVVWWRCAEREQESTKADTRSAQAPAGTVAATMLSSSSFLGALRGFLSGVSVRGLGAIRQLQETWASSSRIQDRESEPLVQFLDVQIAMPSVVRNWVLV